MATKFLLIDDEHVESFAERLTSSLRGFSVDLVDEREPANIERLIERQRPDGLLMDLELTTYKNSSGAFFPLEGTALAQELRTKSNQKMSLAIPIVSLSFDPRRAKVIGSDKTAIDLFDAEVPKKDVACHATQIASELVDLAKGYEILRTKWKNPNQSTISFVLGLKSPENVDARLDRDFQKLFTAPIHNVAGFFLRSLLHFDGPLIKEQTLAIRLGAEPKSSPREWEILKQKIPKRFRYGGLFSASHPRWWMWGVEEWWRSLTGNPGSLPMLTSLEKYNYLKSKFGLRRLRPLELQSSSPGSRFWSVCARTGVPVDPAEAYAIADDIGMKPWHDKRYLSRGAAMRYAQDVVFEPGELERLNTYRHAAKRSTN